MIYLVQNIQRALGISWSLNAIVRMRPGLKEIDEAVSDRHVVKSIHSYAHYVQEESSK
jgi:hypothetical protein